ncbi:ArnT family glycosyltransferase [Actinoallomurus vinaceus]|uniref:ArnT family glycosyltransferase n=1 Tax=Actinoallomurus vinaceus TaxID=1080074 RepID=UPI0031E69004
MPLAWRPVLAVSIAAGVVLTALSARYGYHRDELYFRVVGAHPAWGYPDQPPLVPLYAAAAGGSLMLLRLPATLAFMAGVVLTALTAREMGGGPRAQTVAALSWAVTPALAVGGHLMQPTIFDVVAWTAVTFLVTRWVRVRDDRLLLGVGLVTAVALQIKFMIVFFLAALVVGVLLAGPREVFRRPLLYAGAAVAVLAWLPGLWWQARHGWPQLEMGRVIAAKGTDGGRLGFLPWQVIDTGVFTAPIWIAGLVRLWRGPWRLFVWAYAFLLLVFLVTGGKHYYMMGAYPALWAAGAQVVERWRLRSVMFGVVALTTVGLLLPVYPLRILHATPEAAISYDARETVGWPELTAAVAKAYRPGYVILAGDYGVAGAIDRYGARYGLPKAYSGHNGLWYIGRPKDDGAPVLVLPAQRELLTRYWSDVQIAGRVDNGVRIDNEEQGQPIWICRGQRVPWDRLWPQLKRLA